MSASNRAVHLSMDCLKSSRIFSLSLILPLKILVERNSLNVVAYSDEILRIMLLKSFS